MNTHFSFEDYQNRTSETAIYPKHGERTTEAITYVILGVAGEAGELANRWKKVLRDTNGPLDKPLRNALLDEAGDVLWYLARLATELGSSLEEVAAHNMIKLLSRKERGTIRGSGDER